MKNYIAWSMLSSVSTSPTIALKNFEFNKDNLLTVNSNLHWIKGLNDKLNFSYERNVDKNGKDMYTNPFIIQSQPLVNRLSSPLPLLFIPHTVRCGEEDSATNPSMPSLGNDNYDPQVALDQWVEEGNNTIRNLVAFVNIVLLPVPPLHLFSVPSAIRTCTTLLTAHSLSAHSLSASNVMYRNLVIIPLIILTNHHPFIMMLSTTKVCD